MATPDIDNMQMANGIEYNARNKTFRIVPILPATAEDIEKDEEGITTPNLHRRIDEDLTVLEPEQLQKDTHSIFMGGVSSYRGIVHYYYSNDDTVQDITDQYVSDGVQTIYNLRSFVTELISVTVNGVALDPSKYKLDKAQSTLTFVQAPAKNRPVVISYRIISETP